MLATSANDDTIRVWDRNRYSEVTQFEITTECTSLAFHDTKNLLAAGFFDGTLRFYSVSSFKCLGKSQPFTAALTCIAWKNDKMIIASETGSVSCINSNNWETLDLALEDIGTANGCINNLDTLDELIVVITDSGNVNLWERQNSIDNFSILENPHETQTNYSEESIKSTIKLKQKIVKLNADVKFSDETTYIIIASTLQYLTFRNFRSHTVLKRIALSHFPCSLDIKLRSIIIGNSDGTLILYNSETEDLQEYLGSSYSIKTVKYTGNEIVSVSKNEVIVWDILNS